jgi:hypothetical protein
MRPAHLIVACALVASIAVPRVVAQQLPRFVDGDTLRVHAPGMALRRARVTFVSWDDSTLHLQATHGDTALVVPFPAVERLDQYAGKNRLRGAAMGAGVLGTVGMLVGLAIGKNEVSGCEGWFCEFEALNYAAVGWLAGAVIGAPLGAAVLAPDRWRRVDLPVGRGFPAYRQPFHETMAFRLLVMTGGLLLSRALD